MVEKHVTIEYQTKDPQVIKYLKKAHDLSKCFKTFEILHVPWEKNFMAYLLSKISNSNKMGYIRTIVHVTLSIPRIEAGKTNTLKIVQSSNWMTPIIHYLQLVEIP